MLDHYSLLWHHVSSSVKCAFLCNFSTLNVSITHHFKAVDTILRFLCSPLHCDRSECENGSHVLYFCAFLCACSPSGQSDSGAVCVGDGVASEHQPGQKLHLALLREWPAAGDASYRRLGFRITVSFNAPPPPLLCLLSTTWPLERAQ